MDEQNETEEKELPSTVTLLVKPEQAMILAALEEEGTIHLELVYRGVAENASKFIEAQDLILEELKVAEETDGEIGTAEAEENMVEPESEAE